MPTPVIIDCDPGHDDAIALLLALASPEIALLGVTTVHGNQTLAKTTANAIRVLDLAGRAEDEALERACTAGALAASRFGAQPSLPTAAEVDEIMAPG